jgi:hypothetical protein
VSSSQCVGGKGGWGVGNPPPVEVGTLLLGGSGYAPPQKAWGNGMQVKAANNVALRLEIEEARLARFLRQMKLAATQGRWVDAEMLLYEARQVRCEIHGLQEQAS